MITENKIKKIAATAKKTAADLYVRIKIPASAVYQYPYKKALKQGWVTFKKFRFKKTRGVKYVRKISRKISSSWKVFLTVIPLFLFFYYVIGSRLSEDIDIATEYKISAEKMPLAETPNSMAFLIKREIDDKMWTPNLPMIFPAYVLDNMPNFQTGIIGAIRDTATIMRQMSYLTDQQKKDIKEATKLLNYAPNIWMMTRKDALKLAPSSNSQYRQAAKKLQDFRRDGVFSPTSGDLEKILTGIGIKLKRLSQKNEDYLQEHAAEWIDTQADDLFYYNKGYAFALWQTFRALGADYKDLILAADAYPEWTYFIASLKRAAGLSPYVIRNGRLDGQLAPNHLMIQNYYIMRALASAETIINQLLREQNAHQD